jgi:hypothetical protein
MIAYPISFSYDGGNPVEVYLEFNVPFGSQLRGYFQRPSGPESFDSASLTKAYTNRLLSMLWKSMYSSSSMPLLYSIKFSITLTQ